MKTKRTYVACLILFAFFAFWAGLSYSQIPQLINYQAVLTDPATGAGLTGSYSITFSIYDVATGGTALWTETQSVTVNNGNLNVLLGSVTPIPLDLFDGSDRYLGVKVGSDPEMTPRQKLVSVGYAFKANDANQLSGKDTSDFVQAGQENSVSIEMIQDNAVTTAKIAPSVLSSIDGVSNDGGNVDLVAGSNVTITPDDANNRITIAATGGGGGGDNLGNHTATQNIKLNGHWLSGDGGNEGIFVKSDGKVGIGLSNPVWKLDVLGDINTAYPGYPGKSLRLFSGADQRIIATNDLTFRYADDASSGLVKFVEAGNKERVRIASGGKVGIGVTSPAEKLDVNGTIKMTGFKLTTGANAGKVLTSDASGNGTWQTVSGDNLGNHTATQNIKLNGHWLSGDGDDEGVFVTTDGRVGVGVTAPDSKFEVSSGTFDHVINVSYTGNGENRFAAGIMAEAAPAEGFGYGGKFWGGKVGVFGGVYHEDWGHEASGVYGVVQIQNLGSMKSSLRTPTSKISGVYGRCIDGWGTCYGVRGESSAETGDAIGVYGAGFPNSCPFAWGVYGHSNSGYDQEVYAIYGFAEGDGINWAGYFDGDVKITGTLNPSKVQSAIDHPLDPENKYLAHSFVGSSEMLNIYTGNVILDSNGEAVVQLPDWFEAYNENFRYQLTPIGESAPELYIAQKIKNGEFKIAGGKPGLEVSWEMSGTRKDAYAKSHPVKVEVEKNERERGKFLHPMELGQPKSLGINFEQNKIINAKENRNEYEMIRKF